MFSIFRPIKYYIMKFAKMLVFFPLNLNFNLILPGIEIVRFHNGGGKPMNCTKCGKKLDRLNHFYIPVRNRKEGLRYCIACAREEDIVTLV